MQQPLTARIRFFSNSQTEPTMCEQPRQSQIRNLNKRLRVGILLTMAVATVYAGIVCMIAAAYRIDEYWDSVPIGLPLIAHVKGIPTHVLLFIYPELGMYISVMVLLTWWYLATCQADKVSS